MRIFLYGDQYFADVAVLSGNGVVVAWETYAQDGSGYGIFAQRFSSAGTKVGSEFQVNTYTTSFQVSPTTSSLAGGGFVIAWGEFWSRWI